MVRVKTKLVSWDEIVYWSRELARKVKASNYKPDVVVAVARGGYVPARLVCDFLGVENLVSIQSQHWTEAAKIAERAIIKFKYKLDLRGKNVLLVDDIVDTGESLILAKKYIIEEWKPENLKVATLQWISSVAKLKPDYYVLEVKDWVWFQYPWTRLEDTTQFLKRMLREEGLKVEALTFEDIIEKFREWYGILVDMFYFEDAIEKLVEEELVEEYKPGRYRLKRAINSY